MRTVYTYYKERLIEISGKNRSLYIKNFTKKNGYDVGKLLYEDKEKAETLMKYLWEGKSITFPLIDKDTKNYILKANNVVINENIVFADEKDRQKRERQLKERAKKAVLGEVQNLKSLKREIEEIERETGRYELFLCYPFVYGGSKNYTFKAPLFMFPVAIDIENDSSASITLKMGESVQLNKALMLALADSKHLNLTDLELEFDSLKSKFADLHAFLDYLRTFGIRISYPERKNIFSFKHYPEPRENENTLEIKNVCLLSRCSLANSIYSDYSTLEKKFLTNDSIEELLNMKVIKRKPQKAGDLFLVNNVDFAQQKVIEKINESGNMVIYGPPGTGKSQTIVNIISDALAKNKKVLVVSQKKAALEVIYNRLATLNDKAMFITDSEKERHSFYSRCYARHENVLNLNLNGNLLNEYREATEHLNQEINKLNEISALLNEKTDFGISLSEMYENSYKIGKKSFEYVVYQIMLKDKNIMGFNFHRLEDALSVLEEKNKIEFFYDFIENKNKNPFIDKLKEDLSVHTVSQAQSQLRNLISARQVLFDVSKYKYSRHILTYYDQIINNRKNVKPIVKMIARFENPKTAKWLKVSKIVFPLYPFNRIKMCKLENSINKDIQKTVSAVDEYIYDFAFLKEILTEDGYLLAIDGILNGNNGILKMLLSAMENYVQFRDMSTVLKELTEDQKIVLNFAYKNSNTFYKYLQILQTILPIRVYHEVIKIEDEKQTSLSKILDFENTRTKIISIRTQINNIARRLAEQGFVEDYKKAMKNTSQSKNYVYQISKKQNLWPIRKTMDVYGDYLFKLFPCWLLSPENVSSLLPLQKNLFDIVLFDEASQVFIENTLPSIYRGSKIVVAGDAKQLRPTTTFMKRYMGANVDDDMDYSTQAALEVESLLDLAVSRYNSTNITYHYRSKNEELIDFSNKAFYEGKLQIAPNVSKNLRQKPIERIMTNGMWEGGHNTEEAKKVVELTKQILKTRKNNETIGIITFNIEQEACIEDLIEAQCGKDEEFRTLYTKESKRIENGEDVSLFIKNLENIQGDERDIIIFSIGYAKNNLGKVNSQFGSLSNEGGENRLNVAITRAKKKIYVITSIEPEELKVDGAKFLGPKLLRSYLSYVRAVSDGNSEEVKAILNSFSDNTVSKPKTHTILPIEEQIAQRLTKLGYKTEVNLGNSNSKISVAVYDRKKDKYLLGIETEDNSSSSHSTLEKAVFLNEFLKSRGWKTFKVWSRDWWHNPTQVISQITKEIEKQIKLLTPPSKTKK